MASGTHRFGRVALVACAALQAAACADLPATSGPRPQIKPPEAYQDQQSFTAPATDWPSDRWWDAYGDAQLSGLIDDALKGSPTLAQAEARLVLANANTMISRSATLPSVHGEGQVSETESSLIQGFPPFIQQLLPKGYIDNGRLALDASYDLDLFGKNRAALKASVSDEAATAADLAEARLTLSAAVGQAYADLARLGAERDAAQEAVRNREETSHLTRERV